MCGYRLVPTNVLVFIVLTPPDCVHKGVQAVPSSRLSVRLFVRSDVVATIFHKQLEQF